jgi:hypothetical protein
MNGRKFERQITEYVLDNNFNDGTLQGWQALSGTTSLSNVSSTLAASKSGGSGAMGPYCTN